MKRAMVNFTRRLAGFNQLNARFDALETRLGRIEQNTAAPAATAEPGETPHAAELTQQVSALAQSVAEMKSAALTLADRETILHQINYTNHNLYLHLREAMRVRDLYYRDVMQVLDRLVQIFPKAEMTFEAERPVAIDTDDHNKPWGAAHDNTRSPRFVAACERRFQRPLTFMDLGCSGGGLVLDFILRGHRGYGVEGSDHPLRAQRAEWRVLRNNLFTADITRRFRIAEPGRDGATIACDVVSMWEVLEHIAEEDLPQLFANIRTHLKPDGIFIGSIALVPDDHNGASYHRTVKPRDWWENRFKELGMEMLDDHGFAFEDFCRGTSNGSIDENYRENPHVGFHFVATQVAA